MVFKEYVERLQKALKENPTLAMKSVIYAIDDEGNSYNKVEQEPVVGYFDGTYNGDFTSNTEDLKDEGLPVNAICIN